MTECVDISVEIFDNISAEVEMCGNSAGTGGDVRIENQNGDLITNVPCGDTYSVVQWAGIDEGDSLTVYTDGITDE